MWKNSNWLRTIGASSRHDFSTYIGRNLQPHCLYHDKTTQLYGFQNGFMSETDITESQNISNNYWVKAKYLECLLVKHILVKNIKHYKPYWPEEEPTYKLERDK